MAKLIVIYEQPKNKEAFDKYYFGVHMPLAQNLPNVKNAAVQRVLQTQNTDANLYIITEIEFENISLLNESLSSKEGQAVQRDVINLLEFLHKPPVVVITE